LRSFPHVPCLLQYVSNGNYYGRIRVNGKLIRVSLKTSVWTVAKLKLAEMMKKGREIRGKVVAPKFSEAVELFKTELASDSTMKPHSKDRILQVSRGHVSLERACREIGIPRLTHHDFRHLFATRCIESGVDIPTVSRWLGHKDGGALAMKTYGHLRNEHSQAMAQKVKF
jgi:integrase